MREYALSYLTLEASPPDTIDVAAEAGYSFAGVRLMPASPGGRFFPLFEDPAMLRETLARIAHTGVRILDVEIVRLDGTAGVDRWLPMFEVAARLGARTVIAAGDDPDFQRMTDHFASVCDAAAPFGLTVNLEFTPWTALCTLRQTHDLVTRAARPNSEVLIDTIHFARSDSSLDDIAAIEPSQMSYFQICDAPPGVPGSRDDLLFTARVERLLPGEGGVDLDAQIEKLPRDLIVSVEIPSHARIANLGRLEWAKQALRASREVMERIDGRDASVEHRTANA